LKNHEYKLRFTDLEQLHVTIKFLGNSVSKESLEKVEEAMPNLFSQYSSFKLKINAVQFGFSSEPKPKVIFLSIDDPAEVVAMKIKVAEEFKKMELDDVIRRADRKVFTSHVTVAKVERDISKSYVKEVNEILEKFTFPEVEFEITAAHLIKSELTNTGPKYSTIATFPLRNRLKL